MNDLTRPSPRHLYDWPYEISSARYMDQQQTGSKGRKVWYTATTDMEYGQIEILRDW